MIIILFFIAIIIPDYILIECPVYHPQISPKHQLVHPIPLETDE